MNYIEIYVLHVKSLDQESLLQSSTKRKLYLNHLKRRGDLNE